MPGLCSHTILRAHYAILRPIRKQPGTGIVVRTTTNGFQNIVPDNTLFIDTYCLCLSHVLLLYLVLALFGITFHILNFFVWIRITDEGSVPEMRIWSIL